MLPNKQWIIKEIKEIKKKNPTDKWEQKHKDWKPMGWGKSSFKRKVYSNTSLPQETGWISNEQSNLTPNRTKVRRTNKTQG